MRRLWFRLTQWVVQLMGRLLGDTPASAYEQIAFNAVRSAAHQFGKRGLLT